MVVSAQHEASEAGLRILEGGGNAIDAAVAVGYAMAVTYPCCGNIGGGGFMVIHLADGRDRFIDFRETAPRAATATMFLDAVGKPVPERSLYGYLAAGVPGTVMGLERAREEYGTMQRDAVMAPALALARDGFALLPADARILQEKADRLARDPVAAAIFLRPDGAPYAAGDRLVQPALAATLQRVADQGPAGFYRGAVADAIAAASRAGGGVVDVADLADYTVVEATPLTCAYRGYTIVSAPPPSAGGTTLCEILNVLQGSDLKALGAGSAATVHLMAEAMRHAYLDRNNFLGDPAFVTNPVEWLLSTAHADAIRAAIDPTRATPSATLAAGTPPHERPETTHYSVVDRHGNAVAVTYTLNGSFGAAVVPPGTGVLLNDEMDDFSVRPGASNMFGLVQGDANAIAPGKRPLSSMAPTIVEKDGRPVLVLGSPGGPRIITSVLEALVNIIDFGMAPAAAVDAPRFHQQWLPDTIFYERGGLSDETLAGLKRRGYGLTEQGPWSAVELIAIAPDGSLIGVNDIRRPAGLAAGD